MIQLTLTKKEIRDYKRLLAIRYQECIRKGHSGGTEVIRSLMKKLTNK